MSASTDCNNIFVDRCSADDPGWRRAKAMLSTLCLDSRQFSDLLDPNAPAQLLHRPRLALSASQPGPAPYAAFQRGSIRFNVAAAFHVRIGDDQPQDLQELHDAIRAAMATRAFAAEVRMRQLDAFRVAQERLRGLIQQVPEGVIGGTYWGRRRQEIQMQLDTLRSQLERPSDLPDDAGECSQLASASLNDCWAQVRDEFSADPAKAGQDTFQEALRRLILLAEQQPASALPVVRERG